GGHIRRRTDGILQIGDRCVCHPRLGGRDTRGPRADTTDGDPRAHDPAAAARAAPPKPRADAPFPPPPAARTRVGRGPTQPTAIRAPMILPPPRRSPATRSAAATASVGRPWDPNFHAA